MLKRVEACEIMPPLVQISGQLSSKQAEHSMEVEPRALAPQEFSRQEVSRG